MFKSLKLRLCATLRPPRQARDSEGLIDFGSMMALCWRGVALSVTSRRVTRCLLKQSLLGKLVYGLAPSALQGQTEGLVWNGPAGLPTLIQ
ncbi:unnamed protein product [Arctogadus glacialis]